MWFHSDYAYIVAKSILSLYKNTKPQQIVSITNNQIFLKNKVVNNHTNIYIVLLHNNTTFFSTFKKLLKMVMNYTHFQYSNSILILWYTLNLHSYYHPHQIKTTFDIHISSWFLKNSFSHLPTTSVRQDDLLRIVLHSYVVL